MAGKYHFVRRLQRDCPILGIHFETESHPIYRKLYAVHSLRHSDEIPCGVNRKENKHQDPTGLTRPESERVWQAHSRVIILVTKSSLRLPVSKSVARENQHVERQLWETQTMRHFFFWRHSPLGSSPTEVLQMVRKMKVFYGESRKSRRLQTPR